MPVPPDIKTYLGMFADSERALESSRQEHLTTARDLRNKALRDENLNPIDRAVLGVTGSPEQLTKYHELVQRIGEQIGSPLVVVTLLEKGQQERVDKTRPGIGVHITREEQGEPRVVKAQAGIIAGPVSGKIVLNTQPVTEAPRVHVGVGLEGTAELTVPLTHRVGYRRGGSFIEGDSQTASPVAIAHFDILNQTAASSLEPGGGYRSAIGIENVLVGFEDILTSPLFAKDLQGPLLALANQGDFGGPQTEHNPA